MAESWRNGLCGHCCGGDCGTCMASWWCGPCLFSRVSSRLDRFPDTNSSSLSNCNGSGCALCGLSLLHLGWVVVFLRRSEVRKKFGIKGDGCADCCASYWCTPCTLAQMNTELKDRAANPPQMDPGKMGYVPQQQGMTYGPPQY